MNWGGGRVRMGGGGWVGVGGGQLAFRIRKLAQVPAPPPPFGVILGESLPPWPQVSIYYRGWHWLIPEAWAPGTPTPGLLQRAGCGMIKEG